MAWLLAAARLAACGALLSPGSGVLVLGPGAAEVKLIAAKLAAKAKYKAACVALGPASDATLFGQRALMYGKAYAEAGQDAPGRAAVIQGPDAIAERLRTAEGVIVCCDEQSGPPSAGSVRAIFDRGNSPKLRSVALLSKIQGGGAGGLLAKSLAPGEAALKEAAADRGNVALSIVRVGVLKGGGPGKIERDKANAGKSLTDHGLDAYYYSTLYEYSNALAIMAHDQFALGASVTNGDPFKMPNFIEAFRTKADFEPRPTDASRVAAAGALLAALVREKDADFTVSSLQSETPPTFQEWGKMLKEALD